MRSPIENTFAGPNPVACAWNEYWTGLGLLDWIQTIANYVTFGLDPDCKSLQNLGSGQDLDWVNGNEMRHFSNCLDFIWTWSLQLNNFWTVVGFRLSFKKSGLDLDRKICQSVHLWHVEKFLKKASSTNHRNQKERHPKSVTSSKGFLGSSLQFYFSSGDFTCPFHGQLRNTQWIQELLHSIPSLWAGT